MGTKVLEYIACRLPTLAIVENNFSVSQLIRERKIGITISWNQTHMIEESLKTLLEDNDYKRNIDLYYDAFMNTYNRETNNVKIYYAIKDLVTEK